MRRTADRIRHAVAFEVIGLLLITPLGAWAFGFPMHQMGVVALVGATTATTWNYVYNLLFDYAMLRWRGDVRKTLPIRVGHAILFEAGLLAVFLPFIAWYLQIGLWQAFVMDVGFAAFYLVYAFVYNWAYDLVFPLPATARPRG